MKYLYTILMFIIGFPVILLGVVSHYIVFLFLAGWIIGTKGTEKFQK